MGALRIATWNAEGMFVDGTNTRRATSHDAIAALKQLKADIVFVPEFGKRGFLADPIRNTIGSLGYEIFEVPYEDETTRPSDIEMALLSRLPITFSATHRLGNVRNSVEVKVTVGEKHIRILGVHLDDKKEETRLKQVLSLAELVAKDIHIPTVLLGDFNAMKDVSRFARISRSKSARALSKHIRHAQLKGVALRLHEMALGTTIRYIEKQTHLHDLDPGHKLTISGKQSGLEWVPSIRLAKIDWIFGTRHFKVTDYRVSKDVGSDHRPVTADLHFLS